jgi:large-conductance mechanosensitive channel
MTDFELLKYAMYTTATTATLVLISDVLFWVCRKVDEEEKENKKNKENKENKENKPKKEEQEPK